MNTVTQVPLSELASSARSAFVLDQWYVAAFAWELQDKPMARTLLNQSVVLFRTPDGAVGALEDRCCHRSLPLSCGTVEGGGLRCGYHGMLYAPGGSCIEIPGQERIPAKARVKSYVVAEKNHIVWIWMPKEEGAAPSKPAPDYAWHDDARYRFGGGVYHYDAPYQLIHDNLLDLSHVGYVHQKTIGGNPRVHMTAGMEVGGEGDTVRIVRLLPDTLPPPAYTAVWPFKGGIDRWQEIEFEPNHIRIWAGATDKDSEPLDDPQRGGLHLRGFHGLTPETETTSHYFWTMSANSHPEMPDNLDKVLQQIRSTFDEDRVVIEAQYANMRRFGEAASWVDIHVDAGGIRARRIIERLRKQGE
ncbi:vanillate O-demethylase monooxygenase subunit [Noviherbaspirillum humi]|uniref:Vanillate O-demethylase monooxygenase subunit n=1 Tax=Noviherbaspirillum humi TaxID=1688639 RepID=A0A239LV99_9BURK|nr:aromatic ring-hydroxylating dioxygenase subunit alpha [Noviherbaspirillum humi]SNT34456.1 vanillate O-demethylase monooxygenase subunit [Noviherbaspirillum humi]